jgi:DNA-binding response OmpR family regulator
MRLLLIEDDLKITSFIMKGLQEAGFTVAYAKDGEDGLHLALTEPGGGPLKLDKWLSSELQ